jgi:hypothetical protein
MIVQTESQSDGLATIQGTDYDNESLVYAKKINDMISYVSDKSGNEKLI